jgi:retron-type reverse transcriptase
MAITIHRAERESEIEEIQDTMDYKDSQRFNKTEKQKIRHIRDKTDHCREYYELKSTQNQDPKKEDTKLKRKSNDDASKAKS